MTILKLKPGVDAEQIVRQRKKALGMNRAQNKYSCRSRYMIKNQKLFLFPPQRKREARSKPRASLVNTRILNQLSQHGGDDLSAWEKRPGDLVAGNSYQRASRQSYAHGTEGTLPDQLFCDLHRIRCVDGRFEITFGLGQRQFSVTQRDRLRSLKRSALCTATRLRRRQKAPPRSPPQPGRRYRTSAT